MSACRAVLKQNWPFGFTRVEQMGANSQLPTAPKKLVSQLCGLQHFGLGVGEL